MTARDCAFCGRPAGSREHVWADWANSYCTPPGPMRHVFGLVGTLADRQWYSESFDQRIRVLCHDCNVNWLSKLEGRVSGIVGPMMQGQQTLLDPGAQTLVAAWVAKTVMVLQYVHAHRSLPVPRRHLAEFHGYGQNWRPPSNTQVWLAHYTGTQRGARYNMQPLEVEVQSDHATRGQHAYAAVISICEFAAQIYGCGVDVDFRIQLPALFESRLIRIWPLREAEAEWPPTFGLNDGGMENLTGAWTNVVKAAL